MKYRRCMLPLLGLAGGVFPALASAHVKWFVDEGHPFTDVGYQFDSLFAFILLGAFLFVAGAGLLQRKATQNSRINHFLHAPLSQAWMKNPSGYTNKLLKFSLGILLLANLLQGHFIAPNFVADGAAFHYALIQASLIFLLIVDVRVFALALLIFSFALFIFFPFSSAIDYAPELIALSIALLLTSPRYAQGGIKVKSAGREYWWQYPAVAMTLLQLGLGIQLIILTFHDKLLHPGFGLAFLQQYPVFNFPHYVGWHSFTDSHFVFGAAMAELCFGLLLVANIAPRIASLLIATVFTLTGIVLGPEELLGHVPIIAMALVLLLTPPLSFSAPVEQLDAQLLPD
jgi:hypothetical protein